MRREREKEIAELDLGNIIETTDKNQRVTRNRMASMPKPPSKTGYDAKKINDDSDSESENTTTKRGYNFSNIRDLCESSASESENDEKDKNRGTKNKRESLESPNKSEETKKKVTAKIESDDD